MSPLQFTLFFVALLLGYVLVHVRMARFEEHLQKLAGIQTLDERLQAIEQRIQTLTESADRDGIARVTRQLDQLHEEEAHFRVVLLLIHHFLDDELAGPLAQPRILVSALPCLDLAHHFVAALPHVLAVLVLSVADLPLLLEVLPALCDALVNFGRVVQRPRQRAGILREVRAVVKVVI